MQREGERCGAVDFLLLTAIFSVWIFLFKKIYVGNNLECKCAAQIGAVSLDSRLLQTEERGDGREAPFFGHTHSGKLQLQNISGQPLIGKTYNLDSTQLTFYAYTHAAFPSPKQLLI